MSSLSCTSRSFDRSPSSKRRYARYAVCLFVPRGALYRSRLWAVGHGRIWVFRTEHELTSEVNLQGFGAPWASRFAQAGSHVRLGSRHACLHLKRVRPGGPGGTLGSRCTGW